MTPYFNNFQDFIHMNGHGSFVWVSYGITFLLMFGLIWYVFDERKKVIKNLRQNTTRLTNKQRQQLNKSTKTS
ncbi:heme exporter protein CcmD [Moraxella oblonga]|uniref:heme exporter protein CcmD n=1 Tax=Moraxella oblonga TaxID=200413 RepID=UPI00082A5EE7|nr:heme exporter protein CcmD [Moraxella oblonga]